MQFINYINSHSLALASRFCPSPCLMSNLGTWLGYALISSLSPFSVVSELTCFNLPTAHIWPCHFTESCINIPHSWLCFLPFPKLASTPPCPSHGFLAILKTVIYGKQHGFESLGSALEFLLVFVTIKGSSFLWVVHLFISGYLLHVFSCWSCMSSVNIQSSQTGHFSPLNSCWTALGGPCGLLHWVVRVDYTLPGAGC